MTRADQTIATEIPPQLFSSSQTAHTDYEITNTRTVYFSKKGGRMQITGINPRMYFV